MSAEDNKTDLSRAHDREIFRLAIPAFFALVAEPLFLLGDAAIVGHLGTRELAALGVAATILQTGIGLCVFLAYGTTASVARQLGAGNTAQALRQGIDGVWLAVGIGGVLTALGLLTAPRIVTLIGPDELAGPATDYLRVSLLGSIPLLVMLAATGILRGLQDTRTPLVVAVAGNLLNLILNVVLVYGTPLTPAYGLVGSAIGSVLAQAASAALLLAVVLRAARAHRTPLLPHLAGVRAAWQAGIPLLLRTLTLRAALLITLYAVVLGDGGPVELATHQLAMTLWGFLAFVLDAIAIAAQAITGRYLGAGDLTATRAVTGRMLRWGWWSGVVTGVGLAAASPFLGVLFTGDPAVRALLVPVLLVAALFQPVAGVVFVLDGVLIGAGDGAYLAWSGLAVLAVHAPLVVLAAIWAPGTAGLVWVWVVFGAAFMGTRCGVLAHRARGTRWMVTGA